MAKFKTDTERILEAISNNGTTFSEFCHEYDDTPERGDKAGWSQLFQRLRTQEVAGNLEIERDNNNRIESLRLTDSGIARLRELQSKAF